jgi:hypothetical protein
MLAGLGATKAGVFVTTLNICILPHGTGYAAIGIKTDQ